MKNTSRRKRPAKKVKRIETNKTGRAVRTVSVMIIAMVASKALGMLRSVLMASHYGTGIEANAFSAASRIPLAFFDLLLSAAILGCFIPVYNSFKSKANTFDAESEQRADRFASIFLNFILLLTGVLSVLGMLFADPILSVIAPSLPAETHAIAVSLLRIMFPMILSTGAAYTLVGVLQSKNEFIVPSLISCVSNLGVILYFVFLDGRLGDRSVYGVAFAYLISWALQLVTLIVPLIRKRFHYRLLLDFRSPEMKRALRMYPPIMIGSWLAPVGILAGTYFAPRIAVDGAVTIFDYTNSLYVIIVGVLTYGICNFTFPKLSRLNVLGDEEGFCATSRAGILSAFAIVLPVMAGVLILAGEGVSIIYMRRAFTPQAAADTAIALRYMTVGMPFYCLIELLSRMMYSRTKVFVPMTAALAGVAVNIAASVVLIRIPSLRVGSVALANALGQAAAALILIIAMVRTVPRLCSKDFLLSLCKLLLCALLAAAVMAGIAVLLRNDPYQSGSLLHNLLVCIIVFVPGGIVYLLGLKLTKVQFLKSE